MIRILSVNVQRDGHKEMLPAEIGIFLKGLVERGRRNVLLPISRHNLLHKVVTTGNKKGLNGAGLKKQQKGSG